MGTGDRLAGAVAQGPVARGVQRLELGAPAACASTSAPTARSRTLRSVSSSRPTTLGLRGARALAASPASASPVRRRSASSAASA